MKVDLFNALAIVSAIATFIYLYREDENWAFAFFGVVASATIFAAGVPSLALITLCMFTCLGVNHCRISSKLKREIEIAPLRAQINSLRGGLAGAVSENRRLTESLLLQSSNMQNLAASTGSRMEQIERESKRRDEELRREITKK